MVNQVHEALTENIRQWREMTADIVSGLDTPDYDSESSVAAAASALHLAGEATTVLIPKAAPALAIPILILEQAAERFEREHQQDLKKANESRLSIERWVKDKLVSSLYQAEQDFYGSKTYVRIRDELTRHLRRNGVEPESTHALGLTDAAADGATVGGQKVIPSDKGKIRADVQNRYSEIFNTVRELHRAVSDNVGPQGLFGLKPYIRKDSELSELAKRHLGEAVELCRNPGAHHKSQSPLVRKGICGDKGSDAVFEAYYVSGAQDLQALVSSAWPMALKLKMGEARSAPHVVPNKERLSRSHVELVAAERGQLVKNSERAFVMQARQKTDQVIDALKYEMDQRIG